VAAISRGIESDGVDRAVARFTHSSNVAQYAFDAAVLENLPFTFPEVQTLVDNVTVGGHKLSDEQQVLGLIECVRELGQMVRSGEFMLDKVTSGILHRIITNGTVLDEGLFRGEGATGGTPRVRLGLHEPYTPPPTVPGGANLRRIHDEGAIFILSKLSEPFEQAVAYFLLCALAQFYFDGNKRTGKAMMAGWLMCHGIDGFGVPARRQLEFNTEMVDFYRFKEGTRMFGFMAQCWADMQGEG
jgi:hypothetical protein